MDLKDYYDARIAQFPSGSHLAQVGHTVGGAPIPSAHVTAILSQITDLLTFNKHDNLLDLCCGNGLFTQALASQVRATCGVDLSTRMIEVARADHNAEGLEYLELDACKVATLHNRPAAPFSKVLIYGAWQHFDSESARTVLEGLKTIISPTAQILLGFVPDMACKDRFFDTPERRAAHACHVAAGTDMLGTWWDRDILGGLCREMGFTCRFSALPAHLDAARYRFNALLKNV
ncbi:MAG: class I SAM-dependent methyltransferase [Roseobacter sp.]